MQSSTPLQAPPSVPAASASCKAAAEASWHGLRMPQATAASHFTRMPANQGELLHVETAWTRSLYHDLFSDRLDTDTSMEM